jgi:SAM-dependent methyltransferase
MATDAGNNAWDKLWREKHSQELWSRPDEDLRSLLPLLRAEGVRRVLDLGCGIGRHVVMFAGEGFEVEAIDSSAAGVEYCRQWLQVEGLTATVALSGMSHIDFPDGFFDFVLSWNVVYHATRPSMMAVLDEIRRVTRDSGLAYLTFNSTKNSHYGKGVEVESDTFDDPKRDHEHHLHHYSDLRDVRDLLSAWRIEAINHQEERLTGTVWPGSWHWMVLARKARLLSTARSNKHSGSATSSALTRDW